MGCGQSKINIYPRKSKSKNSSKKGSAHRNDANSNNEHANDQHVSSNDADSSDASEDACFWKSTDTAVDSSGKNQKPKTSQIGGPLLAHTEISESQLNFFRMLDEKIENGPDYDSNSETEVLKENERLNSLLHDWETASAASRSLPSTPQRQRIVQSHHPQQVQLRSSSQSTPNQVQQKAHPHIQQNIIHQTYGMSTKMSTHQTIHNPTFQSHSPSHQPLLNSHIQAVGLSKVMPGIQYQDGLSQSPPIKQNIQNFVPQRTHHLNMLQQREAASRQFQKFTGYGSSPMGSPIHANVVTHIPHNNLGTYSPPMTNNSPTHFKNHSQPPSFRQNDNNQAFTNGELMLQQQIYNQQMQYQQSREFQQYKQTREQMLLQQQQIVVQAQTVPQPQYPVVNKQQNRINHSGNANFQQPQFQTSVEIPIRAGVNRQVPNTDNVSPKLMYRKQNNRQYTQELT